MPVTVHLCTAGASNYFHYFWSNSGLYRHHPFHSGNQQRDRSAHYYPFHVTPYLTKVRASDEDDDQLCCLMLAERVHSGYEGEIMINKIIFRKETLIVF